MSKAQKRVPTYREMVGWISRYDLARAFSRSNLGSIPTVALTAATWNVTVAEVVATLNELRGADFFLCGNRVVFRTIDEGHTVHVDVGWVEGQTALIASDPQYINRFEQCRDGVEILDGETLDNAQAWLEGQGFTVSRAKDDHSFARDLSRHG